ncbi:hypothetical protein GOV12_03355 [Candidatus Pacearchaeota archaeon]|nr:hypothetical protein [Candidatus Pacearchaeota archaeon]
MDLEKLLSLGRKVIGASLIVGLTAILPSDVCSQEPIELPKPTLEELEKKLVRVPNRVKHNVIIEIGNLKNLRSESILLGGYGLNSHHPHNRFYAVEALGKTEYPGAIDNLISRSKNSSHYNDVAKEAIKSLKIYDDPRVFRNLVELLEREPEKIEDLKNVPVFHIHSTAINYEETRAYAAVSILHQIDSKFDLGDKFRDEEIASIRDKATKAFEKYALRFKDEILKHEKYKTFTITIANGLGGIGSPRAISYLKEALKDESLSSYHVHIAHTIEDIRESFNN